MHQSTSSLFGNARSKNANQYWFASSFFFPSSIYNISKLSARIPTTGRHEAQVDVSAHFLPRCNLVHNLNSAPIFRHSRCALCRVPLHTPRGSKQIPIHVLITCSHGHANLAGESVAGPSKESACKSVSRFPPRVTLLLLFCSTGAFFPSPAFLRRRGQSISPDPFPDEVPAHIPKCRLSPPLSLSLPKQSENRNNTQKASGRRQSVLRKKKQKKRKETSASFGFRVQDEKKLQSDRRRD